MTDPTASTEILTIGRMLKLLRAVEGVSAKELGVQIGFSAPYISELETGKKKPTLRVLDAYSKYFGISTGTLLDMQRIGIHGSNAELIVRLFEEILAAEKNRSSNASAGSKAAADS